MTVRNGLLVSGFIVAHYLNGLRHAADWEIPVVYSPSQELARAFMGRFTEYET